MDSTNRIERLAGVAGETDHAPYIEAGVPFNVIALWLGHESIQTTHGYVEADLATKEQMLAKMAPHRTSVGRYRASPDLMKFLRSL